MRIYVGNLAADVTEQDLNSCFRPYGDAIAKIILDGTTGRSRGFAFVEVPDANEAQTAIHALNGKELNGMPILVEEAPRDSGTTQIRRPSLMEVDILSAKLWVRGGPGAGSTIDLSRGTTTIGRDASNDIVLDEPTVSRMHSEISGRTTGYWIQDLNSRNGTFVNSRDISTEPRLLYDRDRIEIGRINSAIQWVFAESERTVTDLNAAARKVILLVGGDPQYIVLRALRQNNIANELVVAGSGVEALDYVFAREAHTGRDPTETPQLILLDLELPGIDGLEVLQHLRADERTRSLPIVVLTSSDAQQSLIDSYHLGAISFIRKHTDPELLAQAMHEVGLHWLVWNEPPSVRSIL